MRKVLTFVVLLFAVFPTAASKEEDTTVCVLPVHVSWTNKSLQHAQLGKPPGPGEFFGDLRVFSRERESEHTLTSGSLDGYLGVACEVPGAVKMTFHHSFVSGWEAKPAS
jgi:hypothetical protein